MLWSLCRFISFIIFMLKPLKIYNILIMNQMEITVNHITTCKTNVHILQLLFNAVIFFFAPLLDLINCY